MTRALLAAAAALLLAGSAAAQVVPPRGQRPPERPQQQRPQTDSAAGDTAARRRPERPDSLYDALLRMPGYVPVEYRGDSARFTGGDRVLRLRGNAEVKREGTQLNAMDSIVYRERSRYVEAYGRPRTSGQGEEIVGDVMFYDLEAKRGTVRQARTKITEGATWYVQGDVNTETERQALYAEGSTFTTDDREEPAYHFRAGRIKVIRNRILVGRPAVLYFKNVPVMALPFIVHDLKRGRRSGLVPPSFEINDIIRTNGRVNENGGTGREISDLGYYWAINDYMDAQVTGRWRSGAYRALRGDVRWNWRRQFLNGSASVENFWQSESAERRFNLEASSSWKPDERTDLSLRANYAASSQFERDRTTDVDRATANLASAFSVGRRFDWGNVTTNAERRQSLADGTVEMTLPSFGVNVNTIRLFPSSGGNARWYNDAGLTFSLTGNRSESTPGDALRTRRTSRESTSLTGSQTLELGGIRIASGFQYGREARGGLAAVDSADAAPGTSVSQLAEIRARDEQRASWNAGTSYQIKLIGSTSLTPSITVSQDLINRDSVFGDKEPPSKDPRSEAFNRWVAAPPRLNFGAGLNTDLFGFFPGVGPYSAIRHHVKPTFSYTYSPGYEPDAIQAAAFTAGETQTRNELTLTLDQTFEAKLKTPRVPRQDSAAVDSLRADSAGTQAPVAGDAGKVTLLAINTSALVYSFVDVPSTGTFDRTFRRFRTDDISNSIRSDLLGGINFTMGHDLFREEVNDSSRVTGRSFSPFLTSLSTGVNLGPNSSIFRFLGLGRRGARSGGGEGTDVAPDTAGRQAQLVPSPTTSTANPLGTGGGDWSLALRYSLQRQRPAALDTLGSRITRGNQDVSIAMTFYPTKNWAVNWNTSYSITDGELAQQSLTLVRNLYRWQANFEFATLPNGNTRFSFRVHLTDLPDLKFDYREANIGGDRGSF